MTALLSFLEYHAIVLLVAIGGYLGIATYVARRSGLLRLRDVKDGVRRLRDSARLGER